MKLQQFVEQVPGIIRLSQPRFAPRMCCSWGCECREVLVLRTVVQWLLGLIQFAVGVMVMEHKVITVILITNSDEHTQGECKAFSRWVGPCSL